MTGFITGSKGARAVNKTREDEWGCFPDMFGLVEMRSLKLSKMPRYGGAPMAVWARVWCYCGWVNVGG